LKILVFGVSFSIQIPKVRALVDRGYHTYGTTRDDLNVRARTRAVVVDARDADTTHDAVVAVNPELRFDLAGPLSDCLFAAAPVRN
jgi:hypothetical protein